MWVLVYVDQVDVCFFVRRCHFVPFFSKRLNWNEEKCTAVKGRACAGNNIGESGEEKVWIYGLEAFKVDSGNNNRYRTAPRHNIKKNPTNYPLELNWIALKFFAHATQTHFMLFTYAIRLYSSLFLPYNTPHNFYYHAVFYCHHMHEDSRLELPYYLYCVCLMHIYDIFRIE